MTFQDIGLCQDFPDFHNNTFALSRLTTLNLFMTALKSRVGSDAKF